MDSADAEALFVQLGPPDLADCPQGIPAWQDSRNTPRVTIHCVDGTVETDALVLGESSVLRSVVDSGAHCPCKGIDLILLDTSAREAHEALGLIARGEGAEGGDDVLANVSDVRRRLLGLKNPAHDSGGVRDRPRDSAMGDSLETLGKCRFCLLKFPAINDLLEHLQDVHGINQYSWGHPKTPKMPLNSIGLTHTEERDGHEKVGISEKMSSSQEDWDSVFDDSRSSVRWSERSCQSVDGESDAFSDSDDNGCDDPNSSDGRDEIIPNGFACFKCPKTAKSVTHLKWHLAWVHFKKEIMSKFGIVKSSKACPSCFETLSHTMMILRHLASKHDALEGLISQLDMDKMMKTYSGKKCQVCCLKFSARFDLPEHLEVVHGIRQTKKNPSLKKDMLTNLNIPLPAMFDQSDTQGRIAEVEQVGSGSMEKGELFSIIGQSSECQSSAVSVQFSEQSTYSEDVESNNSIDDYDDQESSYSDEGNELAVYPESKSESGQLAVLTIPKQCYLCRKVFKHVSVLNNHLAADHFSKQIEKKSYKCTRECPKYYLTGLDKIFHLGFTHKVLKSCVPADHYTESRSITKGNHRAGVPPGGSQCKYCYRVFPGRLGSHPMYCKTKSVAQPLIRDISVGLACFMCSKIAMSVTHLKWHLAWTHFRKEIMSKFGFGKNSRMCSVCFKPLAHSMMVFRHLASKHDALEGIIPKEDLDKMTKTLLKQ